MWHSASEPTGIGNGYTAPLVMSGSSTDGVIEFQSDQLGSQMRSNLIVSKYRGGPHRIIHNSDGKAAHEANAPLALLDGDGLSVTHPYFRRQRSSALVESSASSVGR